MLSRGQRPQGFHPAQAIGQDGIQAVLLLVAQNGELAQVLPADGHEGFRVGVQLLQRIGHMHQCDNREHHPLIPDGQIVQKFPGFIPQLLQLIGNIGGEIVFAVLPLLPAGDVRLDAQDLALHLLDSFVGGNGRMSMLSMRLRGKVRQVGNHFISHIAGIVLEKQYPAKLAAHLKVIRLERQAVRADQVTEVRAPADGGGLVKVKCCSSPGRKKL